MTLEAFNLSAYNVSRDVSFFFSRPDLHAPQFQIRYQDVQERTPGYYFISPGSTYHMQNGPYIFDADGQLVWSGASMPHSSAASSLRVCPYKGAPHLCFWEGEHVKSYGRGFGRIMDNSYRVVASVSASNGTQPIDFHDFYTIENGSAALVTTYKTTSYDLTPYNANFSKQTGWVWDCGFQEINIETGQTLFEWSSLNHVDFLESLTPLGKGFEGQTSFEPWDYFHINSVDKTQDGDYIVSGRHTNCIYKISRSDGSIIWRLGGVRSDYSLDFPLGFQHDVRIYQEKDNSTILTLFNNGWDGRNTPTTNVSSGMIVSVDHFSRVASLIQEYSANNISSSSRGNMARIPGSEKMLVNIGVYPWITEYTSTGALVFVASIGGNVGSNYLATKGPWIGVPLERPVVWSYARTPTGKTACYVSWNGATEVSSWRFHGSYEDEGRASFTYLGEQERNRFETLFVHARFYKFVFAEAIAQNGSSLGNSSVVPTFLPGPELAKSCTETHCPVPAEPKNFNNPSRRTATRSKDTIASRCIALLNPYNLSLERLLALIGLTWIFSKAIKMTRGSSSFRTQISRRYTRIPAVLKIAKRAERSD